MIISAAITVKPTSITGDGTTGSRAEIVELEAEARSWVLDGEVVSIACYEGDADLAPQDSVARDIASTNCPRLVWSKPVDAVGAGSRFIASRDRNFVVQRITSMGCCSKV